MGLFDVSKPHITETDLKKVINDLSHHGFNKVECERILEIFEGHLDLSSSAGSPERGIDQNELKEALGVIRNLHFLDDAGYMGDESEEEHTQRVNKGKQFKIEILEEKLLHVLRHNYV